MSIETKQKQIGTNQLYFYTMVTNVYKIFFCKKVPYTKSQEIIRKISMEKHKTLFTEIKGLKIYKDTMLMDWKTPYNKNMYKFNDIPINMQWTVCEN